MEKTSWFRIAAVLPSISLPVRALTFLLAFLYLCPIKYFSIAPDLDPSWAYALNLAHAKGLVWGRDLGFTYGPFAYLSIAMNVGNNLEAAIYFQLVSWILLIPVLWFLLIRTKPTLVGVVAFALSLGFARSAIVNFGYAGLEHYFAILVILLLACAHLAERRELPLVAAVLAGSLAMMIKFSAGVFTFGALASFGVFSLLFDRKKGAVTLLLACLGFPLFTIGLYFLHAPSLGYLANYLRISLELSDAYSVNNSLPSDPNSLWAAGLFFTAYLVIAVVLAVRRERVALFALSLLLPWFFIFKHGFVRSDSHVGIYFSFAGFLLGTLLLLIPLPGPRSWSTYALTVAPLLLLVLADKQGGLVLGWRVPLTAMLEQVRSKAAILDPPLLRQQLQEAEARQLAADRLPPELLARIGRQTVTPFPWELAVGPANNLNMVMMPVLQGYSASSSWLDRWNQRMFEEGSNQPRFLLVEWKAIDGRHPLLDLPATHLSIYQQYEFDSAYGDKLLLRRRTAKRSVVSRRLGNASGRIGSLLDLPESVHPVTGSVRMRLSAWGKLVKFLYKVPDVYLTALSGDGSAWSQRIAPDVLSNSGPMSFLPFDLGGLQELMQGKPRATTVRHLVISGPGAALYQPEVELEFQELADIDSPERPKAASEYAKLPSGFSVDSWSIDTINGQGAVSQKYVAFQQPPPYVGVKGWAVDPFSGDCASAVAMDVDGGKLTQAVYGISNPLVPLTVKGQKCVTAGFEWALPLTGGTHTLQLKILSTKRDIWYLAITRSPCASGSDSSGPDWLAHQR